MTIFQPNHRIFYLPTWIIFWLVSPTMAGTLKDDFNDGNLDGGTHECARKDLQPCKVRDENWQLKRGQLVAIADPEDRVAMMILGEDDWKDYTVSIRAKIVKHQPRQGSLEAFGVILRFTPPLDTYLFSVGTLGRLPPSADAMYFQGGGLLIKNRAFKPFEWEINR